MVRQSGSQDIGGGARDAVLRHYSADRAIPVNDVVDMMVPLSGAVALPASAPAMLGLALNLIPKIV